MRMLACTLVQPRQWLIAAGVVVLGVLFGMRSCRSRTTASELKAAIERHLDSSAVVVRTIGGEVSAADRAAGQERSAERRVEIGRRAARSLGARADSLVGLANASSDTDRGGQRWREAYVVRDSEAEILRRVLAMRDMALAAANLQARLLGDAAVQGLAAVQGSDSLLRVTLKGERRCQVLGLLPCVRRRVIVLGFIGAVVVLRGLAKAPL